MAVYCFLDASRAEQQFLITALGSQDNELMTVYVGMKDWEKLTVCSIFCFILLTGVQEDVGEM